MADEGREVVLLSRASLHSGWVVIGEIRRRQSFSFKERTGLIQTNTTGAKEKRRGVWGSMGEIEGDPEGVPPFILPQIPYLLSKN